MARQHWQSTLEKILVQIAIWMVTEAVLNFVGLDMLANYSEFISGKMSIAINSQEASIVLVAY